jgi:hypothetical protein
VSVNFFHLDCLASEVRLNVDLDAALTVLANGCYRWLASRLRGFEKADPKQLYRRFVETAGTVTVQNDRLTVAFDRRSHNPILREAALDRDQLELRVGQGDGRDRVRREELLRVEQVLVDHAGRLLRRRRPVTTGHIPSNARCRRSGGGRSSVVEEAGVGVPQLLPDERRRAAAFSSQAACGRPSRPAPAGGVRRTSVDVARRRRCRRRPRGGARSYRIALVHAALPRPAVVTSR